jgi:hypothetical protein
MHFPGTEKSRILYYGVERGSNKRRSNPSSNFLTERESEMKKCMQRTTACIISR